ncbi:hypothetical protein OG21DRAFT_221595 [Imleria badia]|nr:hypothetical protein OG21DRAFT_221595 [Imleria badia]
MMAIGVLMILRVYAMYNRSRIVLGILLVIYMTQVVMLIVGNSFYSSPKYATVSVVQMLDGKVCNVTFSTETWNIACITVQLILGTVMCILVIARFVRELLHIHQATRKWHLNRYLSLLVRDGLAYFLITLVNSLANLLGLLADIPQGWISDVLGVAASVPVYTFTPRFVMDIRELYVLDLQGRCGGDLDTGFGLSSGARRGVAGTTTSERGAFERGGGIGELDDREEIALVERAENSHRQLLVV